MKIIKCGSLEEALQCISNAIGEKMDESKMTQENKPVPHVHAAIIGEWVKDTTRPMQCRQGNDGKWLTCDKPHWHTDTQYRFKPRWFDMQQLWIEKGKPAVNVRSKDTGMAWMLCGDPTWRDDAEYEFVKVSRHAALRAEWEEKGRPARQVADADGKWHDITKNVYEWMEWADYRIKPTPHPDADVFRAMADDKDLSIEYYCRPCGWVKFDFHDFRLRIKP